MFNPGQTRRAHYFSRLWRELGSIGGEHDAFIKVIIVERIIKAVVLISLAIGFLVAGRKGWLADWSDYAQDQLNLNAGHSLITQLALRTLQPCERGRNRRHRVRSPGRHRGRRACHAEAMGRVPDRDRDRNCDSL
jgi:hypothetical protein